MNYHKKYFKIIISGIFIFSAFINATSITKAAEIIEEDNQFDYTSINTQDLTFSIENGNVIASSKVRTTETQASIDELYTLMEANTDLKLEIINILDSGNELVGVANQSIDVIKYIDEFGQEISRPLNELEEMSPIEMIKTPKGTVQDKFVKGNLDYTMIVFSSQYSGVKYLGTNIQIHWRSDTVTNLSSAVGEGKDYVTVNWPGAFYMYSDISEEYPSAFCEPEKVLNNSDVMLGFREKSGKTSFAIYGDDQGTAGSLGRVTSTYLHTYLGLSIGPTVSLPGGFSVGLNANIAYWTRSLPVEIKYT